METYATEEQQVEQIKRFWNEHGKSLVVGLLVGLGGIFGWQSWQEYQQNMGERASLQYLQLLSVVQSSADQEAITIGSQIVTEYGKTPYAALAQLLLAKVKVGQGDLEGAKGDLQWVVDNASQVDLPFIARSRLARIQLDEGKFDAALTTLTVPIPVAFNALYEELKGDVYAAKGEMEQAGRAYAAAREAGSSSSFLQLKLDDLGLPVAAK